MLTSDFDYHLPKELIAQEPTSPRDHCRLMGLIRTNLPVGKAGKRIVSGHFFDLPEYLRAGDVLVVNNSKVFKARLMVEPVSPVVSRGRGELFLLRPEGIGWQALAKPGKKFGVGSEWSVASYKFHVTGKMDDGRVLVDFGLPPDRVIELANQYGSVPIPPYIKKEPSDANQYQTVYAKSVGSVAAPTAGFHFTPELLERVRGLGVTVVEITLHVGLGTFRPVQVEKIEDHVMHPEWVEISQQVSDQVNKVKQAGGRVIAVGTTVVRTLEAVAQMNGGKLRPYVGDVNIFITPGYKFQIVDALITNFHLPKSTLLMLVSAFAGREFILRAYEQAVREQYRFFSFGDAMFIA